MPNVSHNVQEIRPGATVAGAARAGGRRGVSNSGNVREFASGNYVNLGRGPVVVRNPLKSESSSREVAARYVPYASGPSSLIRLVLAETGREIHNESPQPSREVDYSWPSLEANHIVLKPYWAIAGIALAAAAFSALICLMLLGAAPPFLAVALLVFAVGLGTSSAGMIWSAGDRIRGVE